MAGLKPAHDGIASARNAGLRYVRDDGPGIRRKLGPLGFKYYRSDGRLIKQAAELKRIRALAVPPAWEDVWICPDARGHIQATGRDARGRKQYRYHREWRKCRDDHKYDRMPAFAAALPRIRSRTRAHLARPGLQREKVLATVVQLLEKSLIRVGNDEYARDNESFGLTTMRNKHVAVQGATVFFEFKGKSGVRHRVRVSDRRLARIVRQCRDLPGYELFQYVDENGQPQDVDSADVNAYLKEIAGEDFTAKDFRTWAGTVLAVTALRECQPTSRAHGKRQLQHVIEAVSRMLGNTKAVCRSSYIHPAILDGCADGSLIPAIQQAEKRLARNKVSGMKAEEAITLSLLRAATAQTSRKREAA